MDRKIEYMCMYCGQKTIRAKWAGRPMPGKCSRRVANLPHRWVKNREFGGR